MSEKKWRWSRESESRLKVRKALAAGLTPRQIARKYDWSTQNVYKHIHAIEEIDAEQQQKQNA